MLEQIAVVVLPSMTAAFVAVIPVWITLRRTKAELTESKKKLDVILRRDNNTVDNEQRINTEAQWKRILDQKDIEIASLRTRDDEQEKQILGLTESGIKCRENEARNDERMKASSHDRKVMRRQIRLLIAKCNELDAIIQKGKNVKSEIGSGPHQALLGLGIVEEEEAGDGLGKDLRTDGGKASS